MIRVQVASALIGAAILASAGCNTTLRPKYFLNNEGADSTGIALEPPPKRLPPVEDTHYEHQFRPPSVLLNQQASFLDSGTVDLREEQALFTSPPLQENQESQFSLASNVFNDHINYYSPESLAWMAGGLTVGGILANTNVDRKLHDQFQRDFRGNDADETYEFLHANKELGNGKYTLPIFATAWAVGKVFDESPTAEWAGEWGERSLRSFLVGAPPMLLFQRATGASRPSENNHDSRWRPFQDSNGVSGHSFMGALPFINAAKMTEDPWLKTALYAGSTLAPLSRVNDGDHYPTQAALGWWFAYLAAVAVDETQHSERPDQRWHFRSAMIGSQPGGAIEYRY